MQLPKIHLAIVQKYRLVGFGIADYDALPAEQEQQKQSGRHEDDSPNDDAGFVRPEFCFKNWDHLFLAWNS